MAGKIPCTPYSCITIIFYSYPTDYLTSSSNAICRIHRKRIPYQLSNSVHAFLSRLYCIVLRSKVPLKIIALCRCLRRTSAYPYQLLHQRYTVGFESPVAIMQSAFFPSGCFSRHSLTVCSAVGLPSGFISPISFKIALFALANLK